jgi:catalase
MIKKLTANEADKNIKIDNIEVGTKTDEADTSVTNHDVKIIDSQHSLKSVAKSRRPAENSNALSMANTVKSTIKKRKVAILLANGFNEKSVNAVKKSLEAEGAVVELVGPKLGIIKSGNNRGYTVLKSLLITNSVLYDAVYVPGGENSVAFLAEEPYAIHFLNEAFRQCKAIAADTAALQVLKETYFYKKIPKNFAEENAVTKGIIIGDDNNVLSRYFIKAIAQNRFWDRQKKDKIPA